MMQREPFSQTAWLRAMRQAAEVQGATAPHTGGICFGLCLYWLQLMRDANARSPGDRMLALRSAFTLAMRWQKSYKELAKQRNEEAARKHLGRGAGAEFDEKTLVEARFVGRPGMVGTLERDLSVPGTSMLWGLWRFGRGTQKDPGWGHAIAGHYNLAPVQTNIHIRTIHIFDPNLGEYYGPPHAIPEIVNDMFARIPLYVGYDVMERQEVTFPGGKSDDRFALS